MTYNMWREVIKELINKELIGANANFPQFQTRHEAYGVLKEELEEAMEEFDDIIIGIEEDYWDHCKTNEPLSRHLLDHIENGVVCCIAELIQVAAMVNKARKLEEE